MFDFLETRGTDAAGVWGTECGEGGRVIYHKEPIKSSIFVKKEFWQQQVRKIKMNMMLVHSRAASRGRDGLQLFPSTNNENNHPFVSADLRIGLVHNGTLEEFPYLKNQYRTSSQTDSEVLLRIYEHGLDCEPLELDTASEIAARMSGIKDIWSVISSGAMSVALGERVDEHVRYLFLFRNFRRPLWLADVRDMLGQVFFFSSPDIWYQSILASENLKRISSNIQGLIELPADQVWVFRIDESRPMLVDPNQIERFEIETKSTGKTWQAGSVCEIPSPKVSLDVVTPLTSNIQPSPKLVTPAPYSEVMPVANMPDDYAIDDDMPIDDDDDTLLDMSDDDLGDRGMSVFNPDAEIRHEELCNQIIDLAESIKSLLTKSTTEGNITEPDYEGILESLEQTRVDLEGTLRLVEG